MSARELARLPKAALAPSAKVPDSVLSDFCDVLTEKCVPAFFLDRRRLAGGILRNPLQLGGSHLLRKWPLSDFLSSSALVHPVHRCHPWLTHSVFRL